MGANVNASKKAAIPAIFITALTSVAAVNMLTAFEGNILRVYPDKLAGGIPTYCAGRTDWKAPVGKTFTSDECAEVNKGTILEYGYAILDCVDWEDLTPRRLVGLTMFAINVGKKGACGSQAVKLINLGNYATGCKLLYQTLDGRPNWSYSNGQYVQGLQNRRRLEAKECLDA